MLYHKVPHTDLEISVIGLGTWVLGGDVWGGSSEKDSLEAVKTALEQGINFIDTAPIYGHGQAERIVGKAIKGKREKVILATKCGLVTQGKKVLINLSIDSIKREIEESLKRLQVDYIDLYQCHWPDPNTPMEWTMEALTQLKEEGKIRYLGVCNFPQSLLKRSLELAQVSTLQSQYSLLERSLENELIPFCRQKEIGILAYGVLGGGILTGKYTSLPQFPQGDARTFFYRFYDKEKFENIQRRLKIFQKDSLPLNQTAINFIRQQPAVATVLVGCRTVQQVLDNIGAVSWELSHTQLELLQAVRM